MLGADNQPGKRMLEPIHAGDFLSEVQRRAIHDAARFLRLSPGEIARHHEQADRRRVRR